MDDKLCYLKNGMLVFPSRFLHKKDSFDKEGYYQIDSLSLVSKKHVEETIGVIVSSLKYADEFDIIKHLSKGVKLKDTDNNLFLIEFTREDIFTHHKNQNITTIKLYAKQNDDCINQNLVNLVNHILEENLTPVYEQNNYIIIKDDIEVGEIQLINEPNIKDKLQILNNSDKTQEDSIQIVEKKSDNNVNSKRALAQIECNREESLKEIIKKLDLLNNKSKKEKINILHLSDLHFCEDTNIYNEVQLLKKDFEFKDDKLESIDYIILSGDLSSKGKIKEFELISSFISSLIGHCNIDAQKVLIVAGNHDYSRDITHNSYSIKNFKKEDFKEKIDYKINDNIYLKRDQKKWDDKFKHFSENLYESIYNQTISNTNSIKVIQDEQFAFVLLNTSTDIDHFTPQEVKFNTGAFINVQNKIEEKKIKFAIGHHPINYEKSYDLINNLHAFRYKGYIHGHVHRSNLISFQDIIASNTKLIQIGSGLLSSSNSKSMLPGVPYRYNIISVNLNNEQSKDEVLLEVETREREKTTMPWRPACMYPQDNNTMCSVWKKKKKDV